MEKKGIWHYIDKALVVWCAFIMGLMAVMVILSVVLRYVFGITYVWSEELIIYLFIITTYFGSVLCVRDNEHIDMGLIKEKLPEKARNILKIVIGFINMAIQIALLFISFDWIRSTGSSISIGIKVPYVYIYSMFPICFASMAVYELRKIVRLIKKGDDLEEIK